MDNFIKEILEKQHYKVIGEHSSVKVCEWTKKSLRDKGSCYKEKFYGINSHKCCQMTPCLVCCNSCNFCWRFISKETVGKELRGKIDEPKDIINGAIEGQRKLINGFPGFGNLNEKKFREAQNPMHFAISLSGEPTIYPKLNELIKELHKRKISTFLVTNGQFPEKIKNLEKVTQLYLSLDAPNEELLKKIDNSLFKDSWERLNESLEILSKRKDRTCVRLTLIRDINMLNEKEYSELIKKGNPDFVEVKAYMSVGYSRKNLEHSNMPRSWEVREFAERLVKFLEDYEIVDEHKNSRVILIAKKSYKGKIKIDFDKFFKLVNKTK
ncbi:MAG: 4-demethylwyosine synthase TYW1, partial [Nanoarchaeota archaeon]|nr:4-demethylwyosine synthase TYW1 [Nanoarchaeota archaeon]